MTIRKKKCWLAISCIFALSASVSYAEVWGGNDDDIVEHISPNNGHSNSAGASERTNTAKERMAQLRTGTAGRAVDNGVVVKEDGASTERERVKSMLSNAENEYKKVLYYMIDETDHQRQYFVTNPSEEEGRSAGNYHLAPQGTSITGAKEKIQDTIERYKYLRATEAFNKGNIKELLNLESGKGLKGEEREAYLKQQKALLGERYQGVQAGSKNEDGTRNQSRLNSALESKTSRYNNANTNTFSDALKGLVENEFGIQGWLKDGDETLACKALLCLVGGGTDSECQSAIAEFLAKTIRSKPHKTVAARKKFLKLCPTDDSRRGDKASSSSSAYPGATGFNSLIDSISDGVGECSVDRYGLNVGNSAGVSGYNDRVRTIRFNWADPTSKQEPSNPAFIYELDVIDDVLGAKCAKYVTHEYVDIYKSPLFKRIPSTEVRSGKDWLSPAGIKHLTRYINNSDSIASVDDLLGDYKESMPKYLLAIAKNSNVSTVRNWFVTVSGDSNWKKANKSGETVVIPGNLKAVYDLNSKRMYYFGHWYYQKPVDFNNFTPSAKAIEDVEVYQPDSAENSKYLNDVINEYKEYDANAILDSIAPDEYDNKDEYYDKDADHNKDDDEE